MSRSLQPATMRYLRAYVAKNGRAPTLMEIGRHFGVSHQAIACRLKRLERKGEIMREVSTRRGIRLGCAS